MDQMYYGQQPQYGMPYGYGAYGQQPQQGYHKSNLTEEEYQRLTKSQSTFSLAITETERLRGICNHRTPDGMRDTLMEDHATGKYRCATCGYVFNSIDHNTTEEEIRSAIQAVQDYLQTIKLLFIDMPDEQSREFFQIIPMLDKIPELFSIAVKNMLKHETFSYNMRNGNMGAWSMFQNLANIFGGGMMGQPQMNYYQQQPVAPMGQPQYGQYGAAAPMMNPPMGHPQYGAPYGQSNGFVNMGAPQQPYGYQPQNGGYQFTPGPVAQATPTQPVIDAASKDVTPAPAETTVQQTVKA